MLSFSITSLDVFVSCFFHLLPSTVRAVCSFTRVLTSCFYFIFVFFSELDCTIGSLFSIQCSKFIVLFALRAVAYSCRYTVVVSRFFFGRLIEWAFGDKCVGVCLWEYVHNFFFSVPSITVVSLFYISS